MKTFTIENETNNITIHTTIQDAEVVVNAERFRNEGGLAKLAANWPAARLVDIWNSLPGATPVKKFKDRATAVNRIWKAIQSLGGTVVADATQQAEIPPVIDGPQEAEGVPATVETGTSESDTPLATETVSELDAELAEPATPVAPQTPDAAPEEARAK